MKACGTGRPYTNRHHVPQGTPDTDPRILWALAGSGLSLRRSGTHGWRADCPRDPGHTLTIDLRCPPGRVTTAVYICCHALQDVTRDQLDAQYRRLNQHRRLARDPSLGCSTLAVVSALGCTLRDLYPQPTSATDGRCYRCRRSGYRVAGVAQGRVVCLPHLLEETGQPYTLYFEGETGAP